MIAKLKGVVDGLGDDHVIVDVGGVGYLVFASRRTLSALGPVGSAARLLIETHVREDHIHLYGFADADEKRFFALLTGVQGIGARLALAILSVLSADDLVTAIAAQDVTALCRAPGVGKKVAGRIVGELKDKVAGLAPSVTEAAPVSGGATAVPLPGGAVMGDAVSALVNLGYGRSEAFAAIGRAARAAGEAPGLDTLIRLGLKELSQ